VFDAADNVVSFAPAGRLLALPAAKTACPHFALLTGERAGALTLVLVGFLVQHSPDVGTALRNLLLHLHLHDRGAVPTLEQFGPRAGGVACERPPGLGGQRETLRAGRQGRLRSPSKARARGSMAGAFSLGVAGLVQRAGSRLGGTGGWRRASLSRTNPM
jgi:hypothetical protein